MNETRKQIIELISDYMDKTLSEGCLIKFSSKSNGIFDGFINKITEDFSIQLTKNRKKIFQFDYYVAPKFYFKEGRDYKILGHYDITAVLKYMWDKKQIRIGNSLNYLGCESIKYFEGYLPNKPLHLYSEQEEKDLLDILTKLK